MGAPPLSHERRLELGIRDERTGKRLRDESLAEYAKRATMPSEHTEQVWLFQQVELKRAAIPALGLLFAVPNGGHRNEAVAAKLKAEGVKRGVPDLVWPVARGPHHGLFVEMKKLDGHASYPQRQWLTALLEQGYLAITCQGADVAFKALMQYWALGPFTWVAP
jgi:hypothetical protein